MSMVTRKLIAKELYVNRWFMLATALAAVVTAATASLGGHVYTVSAITWLTTVIAFGVMLAIYGISNERKENSLHFVLSLPLSPAEYVRAKICGLLLTYLLPWLVATGSALGLVALSPTIPDGLHPYVILLCVFLLANFCVVVCGALHARNDAAIAAVIILTNMMVSLFMTAVSSRAGIKDHMYGPEPVWNDTFFWILGVELLVMAIALTLPLFTAARRRDFL